MKKLLLLIGAILCCVSYGNADVIDGGTFGDADNLSWDLTDAGTLTISGSGEMPSYVFTTGNVVPWSDYKGSIVEVVVERGVTNVGDDAFSGCTSLASVSLPEGLTSIGEYAFYYCESLASVSLPDGLTSIGEYAFYGCTSLASMSFPESLTSIGDDAFSGCTSLASVSLPEGLTSIGDDAFGDCESLASVSLPDGLTSIGEYAFSRCTSLASVSLPEGLTSIGECAFGYCESLASVSLPEGLTSIENGAFYYCTSLEYIVSTNPVPPALVSTYSFSGVDKSIPVYVPEASIESYKAAEGWKEFSDFRPLEEAPSAIDEIYGDASDEVVLYARDGLVMCSEPEFVIYDLSGSDVSALNGELEGVYVVAAKGKAYKIYVR